MLTKPAGHRAALGSRRQGLRRTTRCSGVFGGAPELFALTVCLVVFWSLGVSAAERPGTAQWEAAEPPVGDSTAGRGGPDAAAGGEALDEGELPVWFSLGAHHLWATAKVIPGVEVAVGAEHWRAVLESSLLFSRPRSSATTAVESRVVLGNQVGLAVEGSLVNSPPWLIQAGLGVDLHLLWGISSASVETALAARSTLMWRQESFGLFLNARYYLLSSDGLELGRTVTGRAGSPVLWGTGVTYFFGTEGNP